MKKTGQKTDYVMKYFSVIRIISAIAIALLSGICHHFYGK